MKMCTGQWGLVLTLTITVGVTSLPQNPTTARASTPIRETIKQLTDQLMEVNTTSQMTFDTRTPPKVKQQKRERPQVPIENSHPGIAEPIDEDALVLEESTKKMNFYKVEKPTTDSGLSTWILLSGQPSTTNKPNNKKVANPKLNITNTVVIEDGNKVIKPLFKRKSTTTTTTTTTTKRPTTIVSSTIKAAVVTVTTAAPEKTTKLTKVKASLLNNAAHKNSTKKTTAKTTTTVLPKSSTTPKPTKAAKITTTTERSNNTTAFVKIATKTSNTTNETIESNLVLSPEAKEGELELTTQASKKPRKPTAVTTTNGKKKKNKNRRKRPNAEDKVDNGNSTKIIPSKHKDKPIGTQIYNYLSREVMPTVGVGLVGLMVTAGLASYFLYPFGPVRRSYDIDRKDKEVNYYNYHDEYSGGIAEEDAIAKVIAGMPSTNNNINTYNNRIHNSRNTYPNRYRHIDQRYMQGSVETVHLNPHTNYHTEDIVIGTPHQNSYNPIEDKAEPYAYKDVVTIKPMEEEKKFVVGNVPKELQEKIDTATPAIVPEHGPRTLEEQKENLFIVQSVSATESSVSSATAKFEHGPRRRRQTEHENEIDSEYVKIKTESTTAPPAATPSTTTKHPLIERTESILELIKDLFYFKLRMGLQMLQDKTESLSRYFKNVQERIDLSYREAYKNQNELENKRIAAT